MAAADLQNIIHPRERWSVSFRRDVCFRNPTEMMRQVTASPTVIRPAQMISKSNIPVLHACTSRLSSRHAAGTGPCRRPESRVFCKDRQFCRWPPNSPGILPTHDWSNAQVSARRSVFREQRKLLQLRPWSNWFAEQDFNFHNCWHSCHSPIARGPHSTAVQQTSGP